MTDVLRGSCLCGAVRFEVRKPYLRFAHCYCGRCRKATGSAHATNLYVAPPQFSWLAGEELVKRFDLPSAASFSTVFCTSCGGPLPHFTRSGREVVIPAGTLDTPPDIVPQRNICVASARGRAPPAPSCRVTTSTGRTGGDVQRRLWAHTSTIPRRRSTGALSNRSISLRYLTIARGDTMRT